MITEDHTEGIARKARVGSGGRTIAARIMIRVERRHIDALEPAVDGIGVVGALHAVLSELHTFERSVRKVRIRRFMFLHTHCSIGVKVNHR